MKKLTTLIVSVGVCFMSYAQIGINTSNPDPSAALHLESNDKGFLPPRLTASDRATLDGLGAVNGPATGLIIFNTTSNCLEVNTGTKTVPDWQCLGSNGSTTVAAGPEVATLDCASAVFSNATVGTAYSGTATLNYTGGNGEAYPAISIASTGLTGYTLTAPSGTVNGSGSITLSISAPTVPTAGTASFNLDVFGGATCPNLTLTVDNPAPPVATLCAVPLGSGNVLNLACHNLGADTTSDPHVSSAAIHGNFYQWGRKNPVAGPTFSGSSIPGYNTTSAPNGSWVGTSKTSEDPCPDGWRLMTREDNSAILNAINARILTRTFSTPNTRYQRIVQLSVTATNEVVATFPWQGYLDSSNGEHKYTTPYAAHWSGSQVATPVSSDSAPGFSPGLSNSGTDKRRGSPVRCVQQ